MNHSPIFSVSCSLPSKRASGKKATFEFEGRIFCISIISVWLRGVHQLSFAEKSRFRAQGTAKFLHQNKKLPTSISFLFSWQKNTFFSVGKFNCEELGSLDRQNSGTLNFSNVSQTSSYFSDLSSGSRRDRMGERSEDEGLSLFILCSRLLFGCHPFKWFSSNGGEQISTRRHVEMLVKSERLADRCPYVFCAIYRKQDRMNRY